MKHEQQVVIKRWIPILGGDRGRTSKYQLGNGNTITVQYDDGTPLVGSSRFDADV